MALRGCCDVPPNRVVFSHLLVPVKLVLFPLLLQLRFPPVHRRAHKAVNLFQKRTDLVDICVFF